MTLKSLPDIYRQNRAQTGCMGIIHQEQLLPFVCANLPQ
jgi:hypothetical protein